MTADSDYLTLRAQIEGLLTEGRLHRKQAGAAEKIDTFWHIGDALTSHFLTRPSAAYGQQIVRNLSKYIQIGMSTLYDILLLRRSLPTFPAPGKLTWSHFRILLHLPHQAQIRYRELVEQHGWTTRQLMRAIETEEGTDLVALSSLADRPLRARFGHLLTYRVLADPLLPTHPPALDFGFRQLWVPADLPGLDKAHPGDTVTLHMSRTGRTRAVLRTDGPRLWTYTAYIQRVIDGDTLVAVVDLGLGHRAFPRLRLRGIDTPELYTHRGRTARAFVEQALAQVDFVVITTWRTDAYGRYLADLKYLPGEPDPHKVLTKGTYLNRQLLREELAVRYRD